MIGKHRRRKNKVEPVKVAVSESNVVTAIIQESMKTITVELPSKMVDDIHDALKERGIDLGSYIRMGLRNLAGKVSFYKLGDQLQFGKYRGETLETVIRCDPGYASWAAKNMEKFVMEEAALDLLEQMGKAR